MRAHDGSMNPRFDLSDFKSVLKVVYQGMQKMVSEARGSCVSFTPRRVLMSGGVDTTKPVVLTLVRYVLERLVGVGMLQRDDTRARVRYVLCKNSLLWQRIKLGGGETLKLLEEVTAE